MGASIPSVEMPIGLSRFSFIFPSETTVHEHKGENNKETKHIPQPKNKKAALVIFLK